MIVKAFSEQETYIKAGWGLRDKQMLIIGRVLHTVASMCKVSMVGNNLEVTRAKTSTFMPGAFGTSQKIPN